MKCISCNNEISDTSTVCPYCNNPVTPAPVSNNMVDTSVIPVVPTTPVLPQDQNLNMQATMPEVNNVVTTEVEQVASVAQPQVETQVSQVDAPVSENTPAQPQVEVSAPVEQPIEQVAQELDVAQAPVQANVNTQEQANGTNNQPSLENGISPEFINPNGESVKLGNTKAPEDKKKKTKKIIILVVLAVILIAGILGGVFYYTQFKTSNKRLEKIVGVLTKQMNTLNNDVIDKSSGSYNIDLSISFADTNIGSKISGTYAKDLSGKALDLTVNLESLVMEEELVDSPLNIELYYADSKAYVLLQNFYENYIYEEYPDFDSLFDAMEQNNINFTGILNSIKRAALMGLQAMDNTQSVGNVTINGSSKQSNIIKIVVTAQNIKKFRTTYNRTLSNDATYVAEIAKLFGMDEEKVKENLLEEVEDVDLSENSGTTTIEIYTAMFGEEFYGMKITSKADGETNLLQVYPTVNGYSISYKNGSQSIFDGTLISSSKQTKETSETTFGFDFTIYILEEAYNVSFNLEHIRDVNPKDAKVNVKNSINRKNIPETDKQIILTKASQYGKLGLYLPDYLKELLYDGTEVQSVPQECVLATNCVPSADGLTQNCITVDTFESITCPVTNN